MEYSWKRNIWTGRDSLDIAPNLRIIRQPYADARPLYSAEFWGDYSPKFPVRGPWRETITAAKKDGKALARKHRA